MIEEVEDDVDEIPDSYFPIYDTRLFDIKYNGKNGVLPFSKFFDLIETIGDGFSDEELADHLLKV